MIDPETGLDAIRNVDIEGDKIVAIGEFPLERDVVIDAIGHVASPGCIDIHSHGQNIGDYRMQVIQGVTTALELLKSIQTMGNPEAHTGSTEEQYGADWFGEVPAYNSAQWDHVFSDGAMFKHGNMGQGIYVDPTHDFCGMYFGLAPN